MFKCSGSHISSQNSPVTFPRSSHILQWILQAYLKAWSFTKRLRYQETFTFSLSRHSCSNRRKRRVRLVLQYGYSRVKPWLLRDGWQDAIPKEQLWDKTGCCPNTKELSDKRILKFRLLQSQTWVAVSDCPLLVFGIRVAGQYCPSPNLYQWWE